MTVTDGDTNDVRLKREVGLIGGISFIVGTMIGSGIFASPSAVLEKSGSVGLDLVVWAFCGVLCLMGALCYAELGTLIAKSGGEYQYIKAAFGPYVAYLFSWTTVVVLKPSASAAISLTFADYLVKQFDENCELQTAKKLIAVCVIWIIGFVHIYSVKLSNQIQTYCTFAKISAIVFIVFLGVMKICMGSTATLETGFKNSQSDVFQLSFAMYQGLFSYDGWNQLNFLTEELENPKRNLPLSIMIGIPLVMVCYVLMNVAYFGVLTTSEIASESALAIALGRKCLPEWIVWIIPLSVCFSTFGSTNGEMFTCGRIAYATAREGDLPRIFSFCHIGYQTPVLGVTLTVVVATIYALWGDFNTLVDYFSFAAWLFYLITVLGLLKLRRDMPDAKRDFRVPLPIPIIFCCFALYLVVAPLIANFEWMFLVAVLFILFGLVYYIPFVHFKVQVKFMHPVFIQLQYMLNVATSYFHDENEDLGSPEEKAPLETFDAKSD